MSCLGVHFAIDESQAQKLKSLASDRERLAYVQEELEDHYSGSDFGHVAETDKAWDAIHRALTNGRLSYTDPHYPWGHVILGGEQLYFGEDYMMCLKTPAEVEDVHNALSSLEKDQFRDRYFAIPEVAYGLPLTEEDFEYTWEYLNGLLPFWERAATQNRFVLFTADQ